MGAVTGGVRTSRWFITLVSVLATAAATSAALARPLPGRIEPARGIGPIRLGMSASEAFRLLNKTGRHVEIDRRRRANGSLYLEYEYRQGVYEELLYGLAVEGPRGRRAVVMVETFTRANLTREGVGVGSTVSKLVRTYRSRLRCQQIVTGGPPRTECTLRSPSQRHTVFVVPGRAIVAGRPPPGPAVVSSVEVREPVRGP